MGGKRVCGRHGIHGARTAPPDPSHRSMARSQDRHVPRLNYYSRGPRRPGARVGKVATYAFGRDYHRVIEKQLKALSLRLRPILGDDAVIKATWIPGHPRTGPPPRLTGFIGKNAASPTVRILDLPGGPAPPEGTEAGSPVSVSCGTCTRCLDACPWRTAPISWTPPDASLTRYRGIKNRSPDLAARFGVGYSAAIFAGSLPVHQILPTTVEVLPQSAIPNPQSKAGRTSTRLLE